MNKFLSRTWIISVFAMCIAGILTIVFIIALFSKIDITWYIPALGFCSGVFGLYTGMEKIIDKEKIKNDK